MVAADRNLEAAPVVDRDDFPSRIVGPICDSFQSTPFKQVPQIVDGPKTFSQKDVRRSLDGWRDCRGLSKQLSQFRRQAFKTNIGQNPRRIFIMVKRYLDHNAVSCWREFPFVAQ